MESHELQTPLTSLDGALGLLAGTFSDTLTTEGSVLLNIAIRNSEKLLGFVDYLLSYEKIIYGNTTFNLKKTDHNALLFRSVENNHNFPIEHLTEYAYEEDISQIYINAEAPQFE